MGIKATPQLSSNWYTPEDQEGAGHPTRFLLKPLNGEERLELMLEVKVNGNGVLQLNGTGMRLALKFGVVGWENFTEENGDQVPFSRDNLSRIPVTVLSELATVVLNGSEVTEEQEKN